MAEKTKATSIGPAKKQEPLVKLSSLALGNCIRIPGTSFEEAIAGDEPGGNFYYVRAMKRDGLISVTSLDFKLERMIPEEMMVHHHHLNLEICPCE